MTERISKQPSRALLALSIATLLLVATAVESYAKPPRWAPAHGWRGKQKQIYTGYRGHRWPDDYGVLHGRCNRSAVGAAVGASVGGMIGAAISKRDDRLIAVVVGSAVGAVIGHEVGGRMDEVDRSCIGHSLELVTTGNTVRWSSEDTGTTFAVTPLRNFSHRGAECREFQATSSRGSERRSMLASACRNARGDWIPL